MAGLGLKWMQCPRGRPTVPLMVLLVCVVAGCGVTRVTVTGPVPEPVMQKLPLDAGLVLPEALVSLVHEQTLPAGGDWAIDLGAANAALFRRTFAGMFRSAAEFASIDAAGCVDLIIRPSLADFQFSTPADSHSEFFEIWIGYDVAVHAPDGRRIAQLPIKAYGRSPDRLLGDGEALQQATRRALRDAAATLTLKLPRNPALQSLLQDRGQGGPLARGTDRP